MAKEAAYARQYRKRFPHKGRAACRKWYRSQTQQERQQRLAKKRAYLKEWRKKNPQYQINWVKKNRERMRAHHRSRYAQKKSALSDKTLIVEWMAAMQKRPFCRCHWCGTKVRGKEIVFDHVVALSKNGIHSIANLCCSCRDCNSAKGSRLIAEWICQGQTFLPL